MLVLGGLLAAVLGARVVAHSDGERERIASRLTSAEIASALKLAIRREEDLTVNTSVFVTRNPGATAADFDVWVESMHALQRYPELQNIGLVALVSSSHLAAFKARMAADPLRPYGPRSAAPAGNLQILPAGKRPYHCIAVAGLARDRASYLPAGLDYCELIKTMIRARDLGLTGYAPVVGVGAPALGVETPVYRGGVTPATVSARRHAFVGWLGERIQPRVLLDAARAGHPDVAVVLRYDSRYSHIRFTSGSARSGAQRTRIPLQVGRETGLESSSEGWTVESFGAPVAGGVLKDERAVALLIAGILLSVLLGVAGLLVLILGTGRTRALSLVREKTRELSEKNCELAHLALHDTLTGLANRALVFDRAEGMLARAVRDRGIVAGALFVDVDAFKHVNDSLGHAAGDRLLTVVGERLCSVVRDQDTVGRLGGDEFVVLVECSAQETGLEALANRMNESLREPVELEEGRRSVSVTASIGVAVGRYETAEELLRDADLALYAAKTAGKDCYTVFDASTSAGVERGMALRQD